MFANLDFCGHATQRSVCVQCGGCGICFHGKRRHRCPEGPGPGRRVEASLSHERGVEDESPFWLAPNRAASDDNGTLTILAQDMGVPACMVKCPCLQAPLWSRVRRDAK